MPMTKKALITYILLIGFVGILLGATPLMTSEGSPSTPVSWKGDWVIYRSGIATADSEPVGLLTPATTVTNYMTTAASRPSSTISMGKASRLHIRAQADASADPIITVVLWGNAGKAGQAAVRTQTLSANSTRAGNGAAGNYFTAEYILDVGPATQGHVYVTNLDGATSVLLEIMAD